MGMQAARQHDPASLGDPAGHHRRLGAAGRPVIQGRVGDIHAGDQGDLGLELEQRLQRALRHLRLIGCVGGQKFSPLDQMIHRRRHMMPVNPATDEERRRSTVEISGGQRRQIPADVKLTGMERQVDRRREVQPLRHILV